MLKRVLMTLGLTATLAAPSGEGDALRNATLYFTRVELIASDEIKKLAAGADFKVDKPGTDWKKITVGFPGVTLTLNRESSPEIIAKQSAGFQGYAYQLSGKKMDALVFSVIQKGGRIKHLLGVIAEPAFDNEDRVLKLLCGIAAKEKALLLLGASVCTPDAKIILGPGNEREAGAVVPVFDSALQRRDRTRQRLTPLGVKSPEHLPPVQAEEETVLRTPGEIARRCVVLSIVAARGEGLPKDKAIATLQRYKLMEELTPKEKEFLAKDAHTEVERTQFVWRYECAQVLLWAMKRVDRLDIPAKPCDAAESTAKVMALADKNEFDSVQLRSKAEILDQLDLVFRCHWAVRDAQIKKTPAPKGLDADCVMEWHQTLNWLIHHENAEWDDVDTGT